VSAPKAKELPWDWVPPNASETAKAEWKKPWYVRAREMLFPNQETFRNYILALIESFTVEELEQAVANRMDLVDSVITVGKLRHRFVKGPARLAIQQNQYHMYYYLVGWAGWPNTGPPGVLAELKARDTVKGDMLSTPDGYAWLEVESYELARFFREFARLDRPPYSWPDLAPPPRHQPRPILSTEALPPPTPTPA
jgi:hypothetical protein